MENKHTYQFVEKLIGRLEELKASGNPYDSYWDEAMYRATELVNSTSNKTIDGVIEIVNQLAEEYNQEKPTKTNKNQEWIPTAERLPEKNAIVLTCDKDGWISVNVYMPYAGAKNDFECGYYVAWMPLPAPYQPKGE